MRALDGVRLVQVRPGAIMMSKRKKKRKERRKRFAHKLRSFVDNAKPDEITRGAVIRAWGLDPEAYLRSKQYWPHRPNKRGRKLVKAK